MKILFFSPFSGILPHIRHEAQLAEGLRKMGHDVCMVHCNGVYRKFCITMSAHGLTEESDNSLKERQCTLCKRVRDSNSARFKYAVELVDAEFTLEDAKAVDSLLTAVSPFKWFEFSNDGLPVGKIASYEFLINHKKNEPELTDSEFESYKIALRNTLTTQISVAKILKRVQPDRIIMFDTSYSVNNMVKALANLKGIPVYNLFPGANFSDRFMKASLGKESSIASLEHLRTTVWDRVKMFPIGKSEIEYVARHFKTLFQANSVFVYSSPRSNIKIDIRAHFNVSEGQKILVASLSSYDERFASNMIGRLTNGEGALFPTQASWCESLIKWVKDRPEYFLIIRVHPREFPNKREGVKSVHVEKLRQVFSDPPKNVAINWPTDNLSIYDLAEETDVFLNAWSSVGVEMNLLGLPVVIYSEELVLYPWDINYFGKTEPEYYSKIDEAIAHGWDFERVRMSFRWLSTYFVLPVVSLSKRSKVGVSFIQKGFQFVGRMTKSHFLIRVAQRMYIDEMFFNEDAIRTMEEVLVNQGQSVAESRSLYPKASITREEEAEYIRVNMESLFQGKKSRILSNLREYFSKSIPVPPKTT